MSGKIDWVALNPMPARNVFEWSPAGSTDQFKRDVTPLGSDAERNHAKLSQYISRLNALRRGEA